MISKLPFAPTEEQAEIVEHARLGQDSIMIPAYAGCTKSSSLQLAGEVIKVPALGLAFNKKIAKELEQRFASNFTIKTFNGLGHGAWMRTLGQGIKVELDERKLGKIISQLAKDRKTRITGEQWSDIKDLVTKAMQWGIVPNDEGQPLTQDSIPNWARIWEEELGLMPEDFGSCYDFAHEVLEISIDHGRKGLISFDDQVYLPTVLGGKWPRFPRVLVDEAQDLSPLNHRMLELCSRDDGLMIAVGDQRQAIYAFRGADTESFEKIRGLKSRWKDLPLTMTFRCPKVVVARQQGHAPGFRAATGNKEGKYVRGLPLTDEDGGTSGGWDFGTIMGLRPFEGAKMAVLCRNNAPLMSLAFKLIRRGIGVFVIGRDISKGLERLSLELAKEDSTPRDLVAGKIEDWRISQSSLLMANGKEHLVAGIHDRAECLQAVLDGAEVRDAGGLRSALKKLFAREEGLLALSSIHRAKGLEWDLVVHLDSWRLPSKWAKEAAKKGDSRALVQEHNLRYVAETRTKDVLLEANMEDFR